MREESLRRLDLIRTTCKLLAVVLAVAILLIGAITHIASVNIIWAGVPLLFLGGMEVGYVALEARYLALEAPRDPVGSTALPKESLLSQLIGALRAAVSLSIWPFYLGLVGVIAAGGAAIRPLAKEEAPNLYPMQGAPQAYRPFPVGPQFPSPLTRPVAVQKSTIAPLVPGHSPNGAPRTSAPTATVLPSPPVRPVSGTPGSSPAK